MTQQAMTKIADQFLARVIDEVKERYLEGCSEIEVEYRLGDEWLDFNGDGYSFEVAHLDSGGDAVSDPTLASFIREHFDKNLLSEWREAEAEVQREEEGWQAEECWRSSNWYNL